MPDTTTIYNNDQWVLDDQLGLGRSADEIARMALLVRPPFTIGVNGKWGSGKTSVMRRAFATLGGQPMTQAIPLRSKGKSEVPIEEWHNYHFSSESREPSLLAAWRMDKLNTIAGQSFAVWYSPWQHQNEPNPLIPLLLEIKQQFQWRFTLYDEVLDKARGLGLAGLTVLERVADVAASLGAGRSLKLFSGTTKDVKEAWNSAAPNLTALSDGQRFHLMFEDAVETVLKGLPKMPSGKQLRSKGPKRLNSVHSNLDDNARLIIFIDDLDRCEESVVVKLLEAIKLYLGTRRCVFVLGIDDHAVLGALARHWGKRSEDENRDYLEKLFQAMISVPLPSHERLQTMVSKQLEMHAYPQHTEAARLICELLEPNPRKVKNFLNSLCASWNVLRTNVPDDTEWHAISGQEDCSWSEYLVMLHYLKQNHAAIWRILERQPFTLQILHAVLGKRRLEGLDLPEGYDVADQRMAAKSFARSFSHILQADIEDGSTLHLDMDLNAAVDLFLHRKDRKRSDEFFRNWFQQKVKSNHSLHASFLYLLASDEGQLPADGERDGLK